MRETRKSRNCVAIGPVYERQITEERYDSFGEIFFETKIAGINKFMLLTAKPKILPSFTLDDKLLFG